MGGSCTAPVINFDGIDWLILDEQDGKALLITKDIIKKHSYNANRFCAAWSDSTLRRYLGDNRFLLSAKQAGQYFADNDARIANFQGLPWAWWLCDIGIKNHAAFVGKDGKINTHGYRVDCAWCGVRPAMWVET